MCIYIYIYIFWLRWLIRMLSGSFNFVSTSGTATVCILCMHWEGTPTVLSIFSVPQWQSQPLIYTRKVTTMWKTALERPGMPACVHIHTTCIHCFHGKWKMVDTWSHLFISARSSNAKDRKKAKNTQAARQNQSQIWFHESQTCTHTTPHKNEMWSSV